MKLIAFFRSNAVLTIAFAAAVITSCIIKPDTVYLGYFDWKTLSCLFLILAVICALRNIHIFYLTADKIVSAFRNARKCVLALVLITFISSLIIGNDMALITFMPLAYISLNNTGQDKYIAYTFILMSLAANLGGMVTPFGNPQNLYLYTTYEIGFLEFMKIMVIPFAASMILILLCCLKVKPEPLELSGEVRLLNVKKALIYFTLFGYIILIIIRIVPFWTGLIIIPAVLFRYDKTALKDVDYPLLGTFLCFFVFAGNMSRMPAVSNILTGILAKDTMLISALTSQVISNVPSAILLSQFTENYKELLLGVNIGGAGTLVASLASLITFNEYNRRCPGNGGKFIMLFSVLNFGFLIVLLLLMEIIL